MSDEIVCPQCGTDEHLQGQRDGDVVRVTCQQCALSWTRDPRPRCEMCGVQDEVLAISTPVKKNVRGTQTFIVGMRMVYRCPLCLTRHNAATDDQQIPPSGNPLANGQTS
jgi:hypothetical protein